MACYAADAMAGRSSAASLDAMLQHITAAVHHACALRALPPAGRLAAADHEPDPAMPGVSPLPRFRWSSRFRGPSGGSRPVAGPRA